MAKNSKRITKTADRLISYTSGELTKSYSAALKDIRADLVRLAEIYKVEGELTKAQAIIESMTPQERSFPHVINVSRQKRISRGSGASLNDVKKLLKQFKRVKKMFKDMKKSGRRGLRKGAFAWQ